MPDFSMCSGEGCKKKEQCQRYTAMPDKMQVWAMFWTDGDGEHGCEYFMPLKKTTKEER
jgi:hypothetical protein